MTECPNIRPIDFSVLDCNEVLCNSKLPFIEVSTAEPYRIQDVTQQWLDNFLFSREEVLGRTLRIVCGPQTTLGRVKQLIAIAADGKGASAPVCFYSSVGACKLMAVKVETVGSGEGCRLTMVPSDAVRLKEATEMEECPRAVVSAQNPFLIEHVNTLFSCKFGMTQELWNQKSLRMIQGPHTNSPAFARMFKGATDGLSRREELTVYTSDCRELWCEVAVIPVLAADGTITHLMVAFSPPLNKQNLATGIESELNGLTFDAHTTHPTESNNPAGCSSACPSMAIFEPINLNSSPDLQETTQPSSCSSSSCQSFPFPAPALAMDSRALEWTCMEEEMQPECAAPARTSSADSTQPTSLKLIPRKKRPAVGEFVEVTTARLQELSGKSMKAAAEELGIAASTLKKVCRRLGVERWPSSSASLALHAARPAAKADYDGSYVRRLFHKYSANTPRAPPTQPPDMTSAAPPPLPDPTTDWVPPARAGPLSQWPDASQPAEEQSFRWGGRDVQWGAEDPGPMAQFSEFDVAQTRRGPHQQLAEPDFAGKEQQQLSDANFAAGQEPQQLSEPDFGGPVIADGLDPMPW